MKRYQFKIEIHHNLRSMIVNGEKFEGLIGEV